MEITFLQEPWVHEAICKFVYSNEQLILRLLILMNAHVKYSLITEFIQQNNIAVTVVPTMRGVHELLVALA